VEEAVDKFRKSDAPLKSLIPKLNRLLRTYSQITWIGTLGDLRESNGKYERQIRQKFRDRIESNEKSRPIQRSEGQEVLDFLSQYGI
jgi:hypothetical protein